jgi:hypothetical protein
MLSSHYELETKHGLVEIPQPHPAQAEFDTLVPTNPDAISRLISAAVVDSSFRKLLLSKPGKAMDAGYLGEMFELTEYDRALILSIQASTLSDLAAQLVRLQESQDGVDWVLRKNRVKKSHYTIPVQPKRSWKTAVVPVS